METKLRAAPVSRSETQQLNEGTRGADGAGGDGGKLPAELEQGWAMYARTIVCLNTYPNGITLSVHRPRGSQETSGEGRGPAGEVEVNGAGFAPHQFHLRLRDTRDYLLPEGRYSLHRESYPRALERCLSQLHRAGELAETVIFFGTTTDPFRALHKKFELTMACLEVLQRYPAGRLVVQTRSPLVISILPALKFLSGTAVAAISIETPLDKAVVRYTPGEPRVGERLIAALGLRRQGVPVNLVVSPLLPYGDHERDAWDFAELLMRHGDYISIAGLATGLETDERQLRTFPIAQRLAGDRQFQWLRPNGYAPLLRALKANAPEKLQLPVKPFEPRGQLRMFAA